MTSTVITLTLPEAADAAPTGTLLIQRGDLARLHQFTYAHVADLTEIIADALIALAAVEADPPTVPELPALEKPAKEKQSKPKAAPKPPEEPTIDVPLKKGTKAVKLSHLKIASGESDAAAYRVAVLIAGRLIDGKLWDGTTPIRFHDVYAVQKRMKHLIDRELSLFTLTDFVEAGDASGSSAEALPDVMEILD